MKALVNKIIPFSLVDGEGNRFSVFLQGCNFHCLYCHNPETINLCIGCGACIDKCPVGALKKDEKIWYDKNKCIDCDECIKGCIHKSTPKTLELSVDEILEQIEEVRPFLSGITISGGECTLQRDFILELAKRVKTMGLTLFIDTNGYIPIWKDKELLDNIDKVMLDVKSFDREEHIKLTQKPNDSVLENLKILLEKKKIYEVRTVIVPDLLDNENNVKNISRIIGNIDKNVRYKLIKYRSLGVRRDKLKSYTPEDEYMKKLMDMAKMNGCNNVISSL
ncbi:MAG: YjjW family glycine radical enzyme activase [Anaeromicrobium sp.]|jgi:YjjW family glycine radical enzyme activase|uniref:YjjW family glycine radical enzyme activase n=1 Tax=Anaeromicrobium sp. TaxID=1929132 RepID=UPI0025ED4EA6|nr:YjjW family glycine radical enzyme activase [Anaeromicrobium sp.]MCT4594339.1 YjjW family glycine radical enzyme activase [Anaeromicrobium sp.]